MSGTNGRDGNGNGLRTMAVSELHPAPYNPRKISDAAMDGLRASIERFGLVQPVIWNKRTKHVVGGHQRLRVLEARGDTETEVIVVDLPESEERALNVALNNPAIAGEWTDDLQPLLEDIKEFNEEMFSELKLDDLWVEPQREVVEDDVPPVPEDPTAKPGDLWILGAHRILCGDSTNPEDLARLMGEEKAALLATDPPYCVEYTGNRLNGSSKDWSENYREIDLGDAERVFRAVFQNALAHLAPKAAIYCWHAHKRQATIQRIWDELGILDHQQIVWVKPTAVFGRVYWPFRHEPCMMGWVRGSKPEHDSVNEFDSVWECDWEGKARVVGNEHPTQKPVELFARPIRKHTRSEDICFEPFSGSGTQIIAAEQLGRRCFALEISPAFVDVAVKRWENLTGKEAKRGG